MHARGLMFAVTCSMGLMAHQSVLAADSTQGAPLAELCQAAAAISHTPSDADKAKLKQVLANPNASANDKTIAQALLNFQHGASAADKDKLKQIAADGSASAAMKELASLVANMAHMPSAAEKSKLGTLCAK